jgi:hypothetical protein
VLSVRGVGGLLASVVMVRLTLRRPMVVALAAMSLAAVPPALRRIEINQSGRGSAGNAVPD